MNFGLVWLFLYRKASSLKRKLSPFNFLVFFRSPCSFKSFENMTHQNRYLNDYKYRVFLIGATLNNQSSNQTLSIIIFQSILFTYHHPFLTFQKKKTPSANLPPPSCDPHTRLAWTRKPLTLSVADSPVVDRLSVNQTPSSLFIIYWSPRSPQENRIKSSPFVSFFPPRTTSRIPKSLLFFLFCSSSSPTWTFSVYHWWIECSALNPELQTRWRDWERKRRVLVDLPGKGCVDGL